MNEDAEMAVTKAEAFLSAVVGLAPDLGRIAEP
jgi:hypothetical protein